MKQRILALTLTAALLLGLCACTGQSGQTLGMMTLSTMAAEAVAIATARAVLLAQSMPVPGQAVLPSWSDWQ